MTTTNREYEIRKIDDRFYCDFWTHEMVWDEKGIYIGQFQDNVFDEGQIFINAHDGDDVKFALTADQIRTLVFSHAN